jgi:hypothetical protein
MRLHLLEQVGYGQPCLAAGFDGAENGASLSEERIEGAMLGRNSPVGGFFSFVPRHGYSSD